MHLICFSRKSGIDFYLGGGVLYKVLYGEAPPRGPTPYPFIYHLWQKSYPFGIYFLLTNGTPFTYQVNPFIAKCRQRQISTRFPNFILQHFEKQIAPCVSTGRELSFEWSHHRISSTDSNVRAILQNSIKYSGSERVKKHYIPFNCCTCTVFELRMHHKTRKSSRLFQSHKMHQ